MKQLKVNDDVIILLCLLIDINFLIRMNTTFLALCFLLYSSTCLGHFYRKPSGRHVIT